MTKFFRLIGLAVIPLVWAGMMVSLVARAEGTVRGLSYLSTRDSVIDPAIGTTWYSLTHDGVLIGYERSTLGFDGEQAKSYHSEEETAVQTQLLGEETWLIMQWQSELDADLSPRAIAGTFELGSLSFFLQGERVGNSMTVTIDGLGDTNITRTIDYPDGLVTPATAYYFVVAQLHKPGTTYRFRTFDAMSQSDTDMGMTFLGTENVETPDGTVEADHFTVTNSGLTSEVWLDPQGTMLREESSGYTSEMVDFSVVRTLYEQHHVAGE